MFLPRNGISVSVTCAAPPYAAFPPESSSSSSRRHRAFRPAVQQENGARREAAEKPGQLTFQRERGAPEPDPSGGMTPAKTPWSASALKAYGWRMVPVDVSRRRSRQNSVGP